MESLRDYIGILSASIIGSFIGTASQRNDSVLKIVVSVSSGISCAIIFTPIVSDYFDFYSKIDYAIAFLLGLTGMYIISILMSILETLKNNPKEIISFAKDIFLKDKTTIINNYKDDSKQ